MDGVKSIHRFDLNNNFTIYHQINSVTQIKFLFFINKRHWLLFDCS